MAHGDVETSSGTSQRRSLSRRTFVGGVGLLALPLLAACAGGAGPSAATPSGAPTSAATGGASPAATTAAQATSGATPQATAAATTQATAAATSQATAAATTAASPAATTAAGTPAATAQATTAAAAQATPLGKIGGTVSVLATWGGDEQDAFMAMVKPFEDQTGTKIEYTGTRDLNAVLTTRVQAGNPPDLAGLPGPGVMATLARSGKLIDLSSVLNMGRMKDEYSQDWLKLAQVDGKQVGIFIKAALKGPIWFHVKAFQGGGYQQPKTWDDLMALSQKIAGSGTTPWSIGLESGAASGWPGTDWISDFVLRQAGPDVYDSWWQGKTKWTSAEIKQAWQTWGKIVGDPKMAYGGPQYMLATNFANAADPLFANPPKAFLHHQADFMSTFITKDFPTLKAGTDFNFFAFPDINTQFAGAVQSAGDLFGMFKQTPQAAGLISWLTTPDAQQIWIKRGGALSPNKRVPLEAYPDDVMRNAAQTLVSAKIVRFSGGDLMPDAMTKAFYKGILEFVGNTSHLDSVLSTLDQAQASAYKS